MPFEFLSDEQVALYGRFRQEPSAAELEQFFRLDRVALEQADKRRRPATKLGWAVQWGTVRMLGVFLTEDPTAVPEDRRVSELERLRTSPVKASDRVLVRELDRVSEIGGLDAGRAEVEPVPAVKLASLAWYEMASKAPTLRDLEERRQTATLLATVRHLETTSIDDALDVLDLLVTSNLLARAERAGKAEQLRTLPNRREHDPQRRHDIYVVDDDAWYHSTVIGSRQTLAAAEITKAAGWTLGLDTPVGRRLARGGAFLERISLDTLASAERWRDLPP